MARNTAVAADATAALLNGISSHTFDFDDTHLKTIILPAGPLAPAALALAERLGSSGRQLIDALVHLARKFHGLVDPILGAGRARELLATLRAVGAAPDLRQLVTQSVTGASRT